MSRRMLGTCSSESLYPTLGSVPIYSKLPDIVGLVVLKPSLASLHPTTQPRTMHKRVLNPIVRLDHNKASRRICTNIDQETRSKHHRLLQEVPPFENQANPTQPSRRLAVSLPNANRLIHKQPRRLRKTISVEQCKSSTSRLNHKPLEVKHHHPLAPHHLPGLASKIPILPRHHPQMASMVAVPVPLII